jgi:hypothetical protein
MSTHLLNLAATALLLLFGASSLVYALMVPDQERLDRLTEAAALTGAAQLSQDNNAHHEAIKRAQQVATDGGMDSASATIRVGHWNAETSTFTSAPKDPVNALQVRSENLSFAPAFSQIAIRFDVVNLESTSVALIGGSNPTLASPETP